MLFNMSYCELSCCPNFSFLCSIL